MAHADDDLLIELLDLTTREVADLTELAALAGEDLRTYIRGAIELRARHAFRV